VQAWAIRLSLNPRTEGDNRSDGGSQLIISSHIFAIALSRSLIANSLPSLATLAIIVGTRRWRNVRLAANAPNTASADADRNRFLTGKRSSRLIRPS
jgi:hypothetical protein